MNTILSLMAVLTNIYDPTFILFLYFPSTFNLLLGLYIKISKANYYYILYMFYTVAK